MTDADIATIDDEIIDLIVERKKIDRVLLARDVELSAVGLDSLDLIELVFDLEAKFNIDIPFNANAASDASDNAAFSTVGDVIAVVRQLVLEQRATAKVAA